MTAAALGKSTFLLWLILFSLPFLSFLVFLPSLGSSQFLDPPVLFTSLDLLYLLRLTESLEKQTRFLSFTGKNEWGIKVSYLVPCLCHRHKKIKVMRTEGFPATVSPASVLCNIFCIKTMAHRIIFLCQSENFNFRQDQQGRKQNN